MMRYVLEGEHLEGARVVALAALVASALVSAGCGAASAGGSHSIRPPDATRMLNAVQRCSGFADALVPATPRQGDADSADMPASRVLASYRFAPASDRSKEIIAVFVEDAVADDDAGAPLQGTMLGGRRVTLRGRDAATGGAVMLGSIASPDGNVELTVRVNQLPLTSGLLSVELATLRAVDVLKVLKCLDSRVW